MAKSLVSTPTSFLTVGNVVVDHGLTLLIDRPLQVSKVHPVAGDGSLCRYTQALVIARDDDSPVPFHWTADWDRTKRYDDGTPHNGEHRWTIQGNDLARWQVEMVV